MQNLYVLVNRRLLTFVWATCTLFSLQAQPVQIQWQRVIDGGEVTETSKVRPAKAANGEYGLVAGKAIAKVSLTGNVVWNKPVPGSYQDSTINRIPVNEAISVAATKDNGFVVLASDAQNRYYVTKVDANGNGVWVKTLARTDAGPAVRIASDALTVASDGSILVAGSYSDALSYLMLTKLSSEGYIVGQWRIHYNHAGQSATPTVRQILTLPDQGYLLVGSAAGSTQTNSKGLAIKIDSQYNLAWQNTYPGVYSFLDVVAKPQTDDAYTALGFGAGGSQLVSLFPNRTDDGALIALVPDAASVIALANDGAGNLTVLDAAATNNGDFRLTNISPPSTLRWTKTAGGSGRDIPTGLLSTDDGGYLVVGTTTSTDGEVTGRTGANRSTWVLKLGNSTAASTLQLQAPLYDCASGLISFSTTGGDGSPVTYSAPGVTLAKPTDNFGQVEAGLRNDPKVISIRATQSGQTVSYTFDLGAYCKGPQMTTGTASITALQLVAPTYNCETGAITFRVVGGDGSPIEYRAAGIADWTTNPNQFVDPGLRTAYDIQPVLLMARQNNQVVMYLLNIKAVCGRARQAVAEVPLELTVTLLENPTREAATIHIVGAERQALSVNLFDARGQLIEQRTIEKAAPVERQTFDIRRQPDGVFLLQTATGGQTKTVKVVKQ